MALATAALKAISARCSIGNRITSWEGLFISGYSAVTRILMALLSLAGCDQDGKPRGKGGGFAGWGWRR